VTPSLGRVRARWASSDVLDLAAAGPLDGSVTARFGSAFHAELDGFVIAVLPPTSPRMPNGICVPVALSAGRGPEVSDPVVLAVGELVAGGLTIGWDPTRPPRWDARVPRWKRSQRALGERADAILASCFGGNAPGGPADALARIPGFGGDDRGARDGVASLLAAVRSRDPRLAARAARELVGRGPGLTPLGDDILAATALTVGSVGATNGSTSGRQGAWLSALAPPDLRKRTTSVSATLLEQAIRGRGIGPVHALLDPDPSRNRRLAGELDRLCRLGHTTGPAYAAAIGAVALVLASPNDLPNHTTKEQIA